MIELLKTSAGVSLANLLNSYIPGSALLLALAPMAAAQFAPSDLTVYGGEPQGGMNMCGGNLYCKSAYIGPVGDPKSYVGQVSSTVTAATGNGIDLAFF